jgi:hypothetical protein
LAAHSLPPCIGEPAWLWNALTEFVHLVTIFLRYMALIGHEHPIFGICDLVCGGGLGLTSANRNEVVLRRSRGNTFPGVKGTVEIKVPPD